MVSGKINKEQYLKDHKIENEISFLFQNIIKSKLAHCATLHWLGFQTSSPTCLRQMPLSCQVDAWEFLHSLTTQPLVSSHK